jgi:hypothetical protein
MTEIWKSIDEYGDKYEVSNLGRFRNKNGTLLKPFITHGGYLMIALCNKGTKTNIRLHRLIAKMFIPNPDCKPEVNHKNGIKTDNRAINLEWCTKSENMKHAYKNGLQAKGKHPIRKVQCLEDGLIYSTIGEAARTYNINSRTIQSSCARLSNRGKYNFRYCE